MAIVAALEWDEASRIAAAEELLRLFPRAVLTVSGGCMEPSIPEGATVVLESAATRPPRFGDVVLSRQPGGLRLHRVVWAPRREGGGWRTQADRAGSLDPRLSRRDLLATAVAIEGRRGGARRRGRALRSLLRALGRALRRRVAGAPAAA